MLLQPTGVPFRLEELGKVATTVPDGPNKLFIGGLPYQLTEGQLIELLQVPRLPRVQADCKTGVKNTLCGCSATDARGYLLSHFHI